MLEAPNNPSLASLESSGAASIPARPDLAGERAASAQPEALTLEALALRLTALEQRVGVLEHSAGPAAEPRVPGTALGETEMQRRENAVVALAEAGRDRRLVCRFCGHALAGNKGLLAHLKRSHAAELAGLPGDFGR